MQQTLAIQMPGMMEWIIIAGVGLLLFGKRLPEVGRSLGKGIVEFKKGLKEIENDVSAPTAPPPAAPPAQTQSYRFDPYTGQPLDQTKQA